MNAIKGEGFSVRHFEKFSDMPRPLLADIYRMHATLLAMNHTNILNFEGDEQTLVAFVEDSLAAVLMWRETEPGEWWTQLGCTLPQYRGRGIYAFLWDQLVGHAAENGTVKNIVGMTAYDNKAMQCVMEKLGRKPTFIQYDYRLDEIVPALANAA